MAFHAYTHWGASVSQPTPQQMAGILAEMDPADREHPSVSPTHESEWCLEYYISGLLIWENLEENEPRHRNTVPPEEVLRLWHKSAAGRIAEIDGEPWL